MLGRIVEIAEDQRHLSLYRGFMLVHSTEGHKSELGRVALDDISAVIAHSYGLSYTNNLLIALAERGAPFVLCGANHNAVGMLLPIEGNFEQAHRIEAQINATRPTHKRLWAEIVRAKLQQQANALKTAGMSDAHLNVLAKRVKSGDPENIEAQGARAYWSLLFGKDFRRDRSAMGTNALLNYGYTVLRAATARAVIAAGLHPSIGLHHSNDNNAMRLVDDLMEPFRPVIDLQVWDLVQSGMDEVNAKTKREMVHSLYSNIRSEGGDTPVTVATQKLATSLAMVYLGQRSNLDLPLQQGPMRQAGLFGSEMN